MKNQYLNTRKLMKSWNSSSKNIGDFNIMGNSKVASAITGLSFKQAMGIKNLMVGGPSQKQYLKRMKRKPAFDRMLDYTTDSDGDMVVNALDCRPFDSSKHGVFSKAANWARGRGFRENADVKTYPDAQRHNEQVRANRDAEIMRERQNQWNKRSEERDIEEVDEMNKREEEKNIKINIEGQRRHKISLKRREEDDKRREKDNKDKWIRVATPEESATYNIKKEKMEAERAARAKEAFGKARYGPGFFEKQKSNLSKYEEIEQKKKEAGIKMREQDQRFKDAQQKYEEYKDSKDYNEPGKEGVKEKADKLAKKVKEAELAWDKAKVESSAIKQPYGSSKERFESKFGKADKAQATGGFFRENLGNIGQSIYGKVTRSASRSTGYLFESPEEKKRLSKQDSEASFARLKQRAEREGVPAAELKKLEERRRGYSMEYTPVKDKGGALTGEFIVKKKKISSAETLTDFSFGSLLKGKIGKLDKKKKEEKVMEGLAKKELTMRTLDAQRKAEFSRLNLERTSLERKRLREVTSGRQSSLGGSSGGSIFGGTSWPYSESQSFYGPTKDIGTSPSMNKPFSSDFLPGYLPEPSSGRYDPSAPKFTYKRQVGSFTRKTSRVRKGDVLQIGKSSSPSVKKRKGSAYPWTKPMQGWTRVYEGSGRVVGRGRKKKTQAGITSFYTQTKPKKLAFQPYASTYELKGKKPKGKKLSFM